MPPTSKGFPSNPGPNGTRVRTEYSLRDIHKPIDRSDDELPPLPKERATNLPCVEDIEVGLKASCQSCQTRMVLS